MPTLWKQDQTLHPTFAAINRCLREDWFLLPFELRLQRAHARTLEAAGVLSAVEHADICRGLDQIERTHGAGPCPQSDAEDLHTWFESTLTELIGQAGKKIHTARSRNDQVATLLKMYVIGGGERLAKDLSALVEVACRRAKQWSDLPFPLQTHHQFAAPGNVGFWALRYATAFERVRHHASFCVSQWRQFCPLGAGAVAGSSIPIDRRIQAKELGFERPSLNALDSTSTRDECLELLSVAAQTALHLQALATDVVDFSQTPLGWTIYPGDFATGSSMMPNKTNPDAMELLRGHCCTILAAHPHAVMVLKGLPGGYNRDLQCLKPIVHQAVEKLHSLCEMTIAFWERLDFDAERLAGSLGQGNIGATLRMERMVLEGMPLREAHHAVAAEQQRPPASADQSPADHTDQYQTIGSASPAETRRIADELLATLEHESCR
jgi:argininosuccinate lyase